MADDDLSDRERDAAATPPQPRRRRRRWPWIVAAVAVTPIVLLALWMVIALKYTYSSGERAGYVQKFSKKGWVCKTWEGELAMVNIPGAMQERWVFTVRDDSLAHLITSSMGKQVALSYEQHLKVPTSCFGETPYYVTKVHPVGP